MNQLLAILEVKGIITREEALEFAESFAHAPQSTYYTDAFADVKKVIDSLAKK